MKLVDPSFFRNSSDAISDTKYFSLPNNSAGWNKSAGWQNLQN